MKNIQQHTLRQTALETLSITEDLPTLPDRFAKIQRILDDPQSSLQDLTNIIETDQATAVTILKVANSSFYSPLGAPVSRLDYAISRLGRQTTGDIALSMSLLYGFAIPAGIHMIRRFWTHAFAVAQICRHIASKPPYVQSIHPHVMFMAGLLHDIGRIIISMRIDFAYFEQDFFSFEEDKLVAAEEKAYGIHHAEAGALILKRWHIAPDITNVVGNHHNPEGQSLAVQICAFADTFANAHLKEAVSIEDIQIQLQEGMLEQALTAFTTHPLTGA